MDKRPIGDVHSTPTRKRDTNKGIQRRHSKTKWKEAIEYLDETMFVDKSLIDYEKELDSKTPSTINRNDEE